MQPEVIGGRYRVHAAIGRGGMGTVWACRDETLKRDVAVKQVGLLPGESVTDSARALREARSSAGLSHPNVVTVFDVVEDAGHLWLVMEQVPGRSLAELIKQEGPLDPTTVAHIGAQVADGLAALHAAGTVHRDVKPGNVLVRDDGVAKITDFGIARTSGEQTLTGAGFLTGTPSYFSPALAQGAAPSPADDVWALGATLYAAVEGHPPYERSSNPVAVLHDIVSGSPPTPRRAEFLGPALQRLLDRDPRSRWSMADASHVLRRLADAHPSDDDTLRETRAATLPAVASAPARALTTPRDDAAPEPVTPTEGRPQKSSGSPSSGGPRTRRPAPRRIRRTTPRPARQPRRHNRVRLAMGVAVALLVVVAVVGTVSRLIGGTPESGASGTNAPTPKASPKASTSRGKGASSPSADPSSGEGSQQAASSSESSKEDFVRSYYAVAPGGTDEAWAMLGPSLRKQGRGAYDAFWRSIDSVQVRSASASSGSDTVDVTLTYRSTNGQRSTEHKRDTLVRTDDGRYLLDTDVPAG